MAKVSGIYVIQNTKNGKVYIGQAEDFSKRWHVHKSRLNGNRHENKHLQSAWNKYSSKAFRFQKLEYCSIELLDEREQHYLDIYMPKGLCYNIHADVRHPGRGMSHTEETRRKIGEASRNRPPISEETRRKQSEAAKNRLPVRGRIVTEETRRKISEAHKGKTISEETRRKLGEFARLRVRAKHTEETRRKMSESRRNRPPPSEETRRKIGEANKKRIKKPMSAETRRKKSENAIRQHARRRAEREAANMPTEGLTP